MNIGTLYWKRLRIEIRHSNGDSPRLLIPYKFSADTLPRHGGEASVRIREAIIQHLKKLNLPGTRDRVNISIVLPLRSEGYEVDLRDMSGVAIITLLGLTKEECEVYRQLMVKV